VTDPDAVVVGSGPNGLVAAVTLAGAGWRVLVVEAADEPGGGTRSAAMTGPGAVHDVCSAIHPLGVGSLAMRSLPLAEHGLQWVHPEAPLAHVLDGGRVAVLERSVEATAARLGPDGPAYRSLLEPFVRAGLDLIDSLMVPFAVPPPHPVHLARFGWVGVRPASRVARRFSTEEATGLFAGLAAHSFLPLQAPLTAAYGLVLGVLGHVVGWPVARGGSGAIAAALVSLLESRGGVVECGRPVRSLAELPRSQAVLLDLTPRQVVAVAGDRLPPRYRRRLERYRYGPAAFKVDYLLDGPVPWRNDEVARCATVHLGGGFAEVAAAERAAHRGDHAARPFVLVAQPSRFDPSRAPEGSHTVWSYCHVPNGSTLDVSERITAQIERFAPGFRDRIVARHVMGPVQLEARNANLVGGDINGGLGDLRQLVARPRPGLHPWVTPVPGLYLCSASTPPGGGVHGMCGWQAAQEVLRRQPLR
jgi:phytoene dehydrogenase-like protein